MSESRWAAISSDAIDDRELSLTDLRVLGCIGYHASRDRGAYPKQQTIADRLGVTREAVNRSVSKLVGKGYIKAVAQFRKTGGKRESRYFVILDPRIDAQALVAEDEAQTLPAPTDVIPRSHRDVTCTVTGDVISEITSNKEEHTNKNTPPTPDGVGGECEKGSENSKGKREEQFAALWETWPAKGRKRSAGLAACHEAFEAAAADTAPAEIVAAARAFLRETDPAYAPGLQKWLALRQFEHFINRPNSATPASGSELAGHPRPTDGRAGACLRALVDRFGEKKINAWLNGAEWRETEVVVATDYERLRVEQEFGGILRLFQFEAKAAA